MVERALGRTRAVQQPGRHHPPYLQAGLRRLNATTLDARFFPPDRRIDEDRVSGHVNLHGRDITRFITAPSHAIFAERDDLEFRLAIHRFAWLPRHAASLRDEDIARIWNWWRGSFIERDDAWVWHPYTAGERILNIFDVLETRRIEAVEQTLASSLDLHLDRIIGGLEYFGTATGNHLTNNGRALYRIGLSIGDQPTIDMGLTILREETRRILDDCGFLREGSSHYQLLITHWLLDVWRSAVRGRRAEAAELQALAVRALAASRSLAMGGRYPLIGDVSPDRDPEDIADLTQSNDATASSWLARLPSEDRAAILALHVPVAGSPPGSEWKKSRWSGWTFLTHVPDTGWNPIPGHGHQDLTGFELHHHDEAIVVDPGRGRYGEMGESYLYRSARVHSIIEVDGVAPYPLNRGLYSVAFRDAVVGEAPICVEESETQAWTLSHAGFSRMPGVGEAQRRWYYDNARDSVMIDDRIAGTRSCTIIRRLVTPLRVEASPRGVKLVGQTTNYLVIGEGAIRIKPLIIWSAYGEGTPGTAIEWASETTLPFRATLTISPVI